MLIDISEEDLKVLKEYREGNLTVKPIQPVIDRILIGAVREESPIKEEQSHSLAGFHPILDPKTGVIYEYKIEKSKTLPDYYFGAVKLRGRRETIITIDGKWCEYYGKSNVPEDHPCVQLLIDFVERNYSSVEN